MWDLSLSAWLALALGCYSVGWYAWRLYWEKCTMSDVKPKIDAEDSWLLSDGQLWGRTARDAHKKGTLCSISMPGGYRHPVGQGEKM